MNLQRLITFNLALLLFGSHPEMNLYMLRGFLVVVIGFLLFVYPVPFHPIGKDEPKYLAASKTMVETGDYLVPRFNCHLRFDKPPLSYWLIALGYRMLGAKASSGRAILGLSGLFTALLIYLWLLEYGEVLAFWSALTLMATFYPTVIFSLALPDGLLTLFICMAVVAVYKGRWKLFSVASALGVLTKGPVGLVLPLIITFPQLGKLREKLKEISRLFLIIAAPWYVIMIAKFGWAYVKNFFIFHNLERFTKGVSGHSTQWWYYLANYPWIFFPTGILLFYALLMKKEREIPPFMFRRLTLWIFSVLLFYQLARTKIAHYIVPAAFPMAALVAWEFHNERWFKRLISVTLSIYLVVKLVILPVWDRTRCDVVAVGVAKEIADIAGCSLKAHGTVKYLTVYETGMCLPSGRERLIRKIFVCGSYDVYLAELNGSCTIVVR